MQIHVLLAEPVRPREPRPLALPRSATAPLAATVEAVAAGPGPFQGARRPDPAARVERTARGLAARRPS